MRKIISQIMAFSPQSLLSSLSRERCVANMKELPHIVHGDRKPAANASVLIPLCVVNEEVCILYTLRSSNLKNHSGQVSFPGGKTDGNESITQTALREAEEEIGLPSQNVDVWGLMSPVQGRDKNLLITPVVGEIKNFDIKNLKQNEDEVEEIFTVPIYSLCDPQNHGYLVYKPPLPVYISKHYVWGITGLLTHMFIQCLVPEDLYKFSFKGKKFQLDELMPQSKI